MPYSDIQLAVAFIQTGELSDALDAINRHLASAPQDDDGHRMRAELLMRQEATDALNAALTDLETINTLLPHDYLLRATLLRRLHRTHEAIQTLSRGHERFPDDERLLEQLVQLLRDVGDLQQARALVLQRPPDDWQWRSWAGELAAADGDATAAIDHFSAAIDHLRTRYDLDGEQPAQLADMMQMTVAGAFARLHLNRGSVYQQRGQLPEAAYDFAVAARMLPGDVSITLKRGIVAWLDDDPQTAVALCREALTATSENLRTILAAMLDDHPELRDQLSL